MKDDWHWTRLVAFLLVAGAGCCCRRAEPQQEARDSHPVEAPADPSELHADLLARFRERASADEAREYERLAAASDPASRTHAVEMVLFKMSDNELFALGITQVKQPGGLEWAVAWSTDSEEDFAAIDAALVRAGIRAGGSAGLGRAGWYVPRGQFFRARTALLADDRVRALETIHVVDPRLGRG